jgi:hypothetical protein
MVARYAVDAIVARLVEAAFDNAAINYCITIQHKKVHPVNFDSSYCASPYIFLYFI